jgi:hypothetical protein
MIFASHHNLNGDQTSFTSLGKLVGVVTSNRKLAAVVAAVLLCFLLFLAAMSYRVANAELSANPDQTNSDIINNKDNSVQPAPITNGTTAPNTPSKQSTSSSININMQSSSYSSSNSGESHSSANLNVNGEDIPVSNGSIKKHIKSDDGSGRRRYVKIFGHSTRRRRA